MLHLWLAWLIDKFITEETMVRCCGTCQGGCSNPAVCFICVGYTGETLNEYVKRKGKDNLMKEFNERYGFYDL